MNSMKFGSIKLTTSIPMEPPKLTFFCNFSVFSKMEGTVFYVGISIFVHKVPKPLYQLGTNHTTMTWLSQKPPQSGSHFHLLYI